MTKREVIVTADGSTTLVDPELNETYHSRHGAVTESDHVFIRNGLNKLIEDGKNQIRLLEIGFGTGLNALLTINRLTPDLELHYTTLEPFPIEPEIVDQLSFPGVEWNIDLKQVLDNLHSASWNISEEIVKGFTLHKIDEPLMSWQPADTGYDLIYFDAFAPSKQPDLWEEEVFAKLYALSSKGAILVTYCAQGQFRRHLRSAGFTVEVLEGPPGKREMTRATKPF